MEPATVLITGAAGFLGRAFAEYHYRNSDEVTTVDDLSNLHNASPTGVHVLTHKMDAADYFAHNTEVKFDIAYHFAAPVGGRVKIEGDPLFNADSLRLDSAFFRWAPGRVGIAVYPSSSAVYGVTYQEEAGARLTEDMFHPANVLWPQPDQMYGFTKMAGEILAHAAAKYGLNTLCLRPFSGYGPGQSMEYPVPSICARAKRHDDPLVVWGSGSQQRDFVYIDDLVGATIARLNAGVHGYQSMNIASGHGTSFLQIAGLAAKICGYQPAIVVDQDKPQGVNVRIGQNDLMRTHYSNQVPLLTGLRRVIEALP